MGRRRRSVKLLMAAVAAVALELMLLRPWLFEASDSPAPLAPFLAPLGVWPVFLALPPGLVAAMDSTGRTRHFFVAASTVGLILAAAHCAAILAFPGAVAAWAGRVDDSFIYRQPHWAISRAIREGLRDNWLLPRNCCLDLLLALPALGLSLMVGGLASLLMETTSTLPPAPSRHSAPHDS